MRGNVLRKGEEDFFTGRGGPPFNAICFWREKGRRGTLRKKGKRGGGGGGGEPGESWCACQEQKKKRMTFLKIS